MRVLTPVALAVLLHAGTALGHEPCDADDLRRLSVVPFMLGMRGAILRRDNLPLVGPLPAERVLRVPKDTSPERRKALAAAFERSSSVLERATAFAALDYQLTGRPYGQRTLIDFFIRGTDAGEAEVDAVVMFLRANDRDDVARALSTAAALVREADTASRGIFDRATGGPLDGRVADLLIGSRKRGVEPDHDLVAALLGLSGLIRSLPPMSEAAVRILEYHADAQMILFKGADRLNRVARYNELNDNIEACTRAPSRWDEARRILALPEPFRSNAVLLRAHPIIDGQGFGGLLSGPLR